MNSRERTVLIFLAVSNILLLSLNLVQYQQSQASVEFKYIAFLPDKSKPPIEFVDKIWINGAPDSNNRPFYFRSGSIIVVQAPETVETPFGTAHFSFWQKDEGLTFQGEISSGTTLTIVAEGKQIWWANYVLG